ncbi:MAG: hypothetical protein ABIO46_10340, partial [Chitinophagales bacterium]
MKFNCLNHASLAALRQAQYKLCRNLEQVIVLNDFKTASSAIWNKKIPSGSGRDSETYKERSVA